jgi:hypothetical protein
MALACLLTDHRLILKQLFLLLDWRLLDGLSELIGSVTAANLR